MVAISQGVHARREAKRTRLLVEDCIVDALDLTGVERHKHQKGYQSLAVSGQMLSSRHQTVSGVIR